ncbi:MAG: DoxX family protein [Bacteroidetes bacterium]|nr:MAG: DoxX family protein [Bacteroidota bacterium]MBL1145699.1 DoxX family protein [Bacteroidota bacterium]MCB0802972.1 DoxX family protein [Flavobacteriales bacterium]NOG58493.1 DoxX family protein [Bacteroidota bacterium]
METTKNKKIASYVIQGVVALMFLMGAINNLMQTEMAIIGATTMGYQETSVFSMGVVLLAATILYLFPKTIVLGAAFLTAWLGGAVATHLINEDPMINFIFPIIFGILIWVSIWLRSEKLRDVFPIN